MTLSWQAKLQKTLDILYSGTTSLKELAGLSGFDPFSFYKGSDLTGLDLRGQDLSGLNFEGADLRLSSLSGVAYDHGAFNGAKLNSEYKDLQDAFDCFLADLDYDELHRIYAFVSFREETLERCIGLADMSYQNLASVTEISVATIRKARRSEAVTQETAKAISGALFGQSQLDYLEGSRSLAVLLRQPMIRFLAVNPTGGFLPLERRRMVRLFQIVRSIVLARPDRASRQDTYGWRDGPDLIELLAGIYEPPTVLQRPEIVGETGSQPSLFTDDSEI